MNVKFEDKSMQFFYKMMMVRFEASIDDIKRVDIKQLNTFIKNEMASVIFIYALAEYIKNHFDEYKKEYGDQSQKLSAVDISIVRNEFYKTYQNEIMPSLVELLSTQ